jgi:LPXTG-motif cell wall-anchored protein
MLLALTPAAAFADGAGDDQYQDPLTTPSTPKQPKKKATTAPAATTTTPAQSVAPAATTGTQTAAPAATSSSQELPRTGAPAGLIGLAGVTLIASGAALRRRTASG